MKTVFSNDMVAHVWNTQTQDSGRSANGNLYFTGRTLWSYGRHFPVGVIMPDGRVILNSDSYGITTSRHKRKAESATLNRVQIHVAGLSRIDDTLRRIADGSTDKGIRAAIESHISRHVTNRETGEYLLKLAGAADPAAAFRRIRKAAERAAAKAKAKAARDERDSRLRDASNATKMSPAERDEWRDRLGDYDLHRAATRLYHAHRAAKAAGRTAQAAAVWSLLKSVRERIAFRERTKRIRERAGSMARDCHDLWSHLEQHKAGGLSQAWQYEAMSRAAGHVARYGRAIGGLKRETFETIAWESNVIADRLRAESRQREFERQAAARAEWLAGGTAYWYGTDPAGGALLRVKGLQRDESGAIVAGTLQTSLGADVPLTHAVRAFPFIAACREHGREWRSNGHTIPVGHFRLDSIDSQGNFWAGCHLINWPETERIAAEIGLI